MKIVKFFVFNFFTFICFHFSSIKSQQNYSGNEVLDCTNESLYTCNGQNPSCTSFLVFNPQPPYTSVTTIAALMSADPSELALINNVSETTVFPPHKLIIIPVNCSCSHQYYQSFTVFQTKPHAKTYFIIANLTFQGLSTCGSLKHANLYTESELEDGFELRVPLRCACPTKDQILNGIKYLLTYSISFGDTLNGVASRFNVSAESVLEANGLSRRSTLFPFTTLLIPLREKPSVFLTVTRIYRPRTSVSFVEISKPRKSLKVVRAAMCSSLVFIVVLLAVLGVIYRRKREKEEDSDGKISPEDLLVKIASFERVIKVYSFKEMRKATRNFAHKRRINGSVYKGVFGNKIFAVKKMGIDVSKQVKMLSKINHINLTKLYGFCKHQDSWYLVFEYMSMGSLKDWLKESKRSLCQRVQIAIDVAYGLHYLHSFTKPGYVHNNINSSNILIDGNLRAKISNFSLARTMDDENDMNALMMTTKIVGTRRYMAPEIVENGLITSKVDVYSFGVVLLELITGKDPVVKHRGKEVLLSRTMSEIIEGEDAESEIRSMIDLENEENGNMECAIQVVKLGLNCLKQDPGSRPSMDEVVSCLVKIQVDLQTAEICYLQKQITEFDFGYVYIDDEECCN